MDNLSALIEITCPIHWLQGPWNESRQFEIFGDSRFFINFPLFLFLLIFIFRGLSASLFLFRQQFIAALLIFATSFSCSFYIFAFSSCSTSSVIYSMSTSPSSLICSKLCCTYYTLCLSICSSCTPLSFSFSTFPPFLTQPCALRVVLLSWGA